MMSASRIAAEIQALIAQHADHAAIRRKLVGYRDAGLSQAETLTVLESLRAAATDEATDDRILEVMDLVEGFCSPETTVWEDRSSTPDAI